MIIYRENLFTPTETFIYEQAQQIRLWRPIIVGGHVTNANVPPAGLQAVSLTKGKVSRAWHLLGNPRLPNVIRDENPRIVHAHFAHDGIFARRVAKQLNCPYIITLHGMDVAVRPWHQIRSLNPVAVQYLVHRREIQNAAARFICVSSFIREEAIKAGFPEDKCVLLHIGTRPVGDLGTFTKCNPDAFTIIQVGRLVIKKGVATSIRAVARLRRSGFGCFLRIVGDGPLRDELVSLSHHLGVAPYIRFEGHLGYRDALSAIANADILAMPSTRAPNGDAEGLGMVLLEAAARNTPIVASRHGGIVDFIQHESTGLLFEPDDSDEMAERIEQLVSNPDLALRLSRNASDRRGRDFDLTTQTEKLERLYDEVVKEHYDV